jgi:hypothetical protein
MGSGVFGDGAVYPVVFDISSRTRAKFANESLASDTYKVIEYWLFYAGDEWTARSSVGTIKQQHLSDWEMVGVGLDKNRLPLFVAYSGHCGGIWRPWNRSLTVATRVSPLSVLLTADKTVQSSHPLIEVALGSHANYPTTRLHEPDWLGCGVESDYLAKAVGVVTFIAAARERTSAVGPTQIPDVQSIAATKRVASWRWYWGPSDTTTIGYLKAPGGGNGPEAPAYQSKWTHPLYTFFKGDHWGCDLPKARCRHESS